MKRALQKLKKQKEMIRQLQDEKTEEKLWEAIILFQGKHFHTVSGLPFSYEIKRGRNGQLTKELWINRRENSKSLTWSSIRLAFENVKTGTEVFKRPKALGDIRGISYIYAIFYRLGLICVPAKNAQKMRGAGMCGCRFHRRSEKSLLERLRAQQKFLSAPCNGQGKCGKCAVRFLKGAKEPLACEQKIFSKEQLADGWRLACKSYPKGEFEVELPDSEDKIYAETSWLGTEDGVYENADTLECGYGIAVDIGTTTIAGALFDLKKGAKLQTMAVVNHQRAYGADVISRIQASNEGKKWELQRCVRQDIKNIVTCFAEQHTIPFSGIKKIAVAGNTVMCHLLCGFSCETLGCAPFVPTNLSLLEKSAAEVLGMKELTAEMTVFPGISAFVGADITAGIAACGLHRQKEKKFRMFLDIGTNGEMVLQSDEKIYAASASAGPALEGGNISAGMASVPGAICHAAMDAEETLRLEVLGQETPCGICGTGMIDLLYELKAHGIIDENGTLCDKYFDTGYPLNEKIVFLQRDIREFQMAKAAIRAGIELLFERAGIDMGQMSVCYLAGGFGTQIDVNKAIGIGLLPKQFAGKVQPVGNAVLEGTGEYLFGKLKKQELEEIAAGTVVINLAEEDSFHGQYMKRLLF